MRGFSTPFSSDPKTTETAKIVLGCVVLSCLLGIGLDLVTAHVAVEYFTVHHPKVVSSKEPVVMAFVWGVGASWWFGLIAGVVLAVVNGRVACPLPPRRVLIAVARGCVYLWLALMVILVLMYGLASLVPDSVRGPNFESDRRLMAVALTHMTEYVLGGVAVLFLAFRVRSLARRGLPVDPP